jgi:iron complex outermembrane receptor protein
VLGVKSPRTATIPTGSGSGRALLLATLLTAVPDVAPGSSRDGEVLDAVVVTARRVEERAADLPLAIDVFTTDTLRDAGTSSLAGVAALAPGLSAESPFGASGSILTLRGQAPLTNTGDNVAVFVDGVFQANRSVIDLDLLDVERVEIVRGPQNALFGHSAFAGVVQLVSVAPTREPSMGWTVEGGSDAWLSGQAFLSGPIASSGWLGRVAVSARHADGTIDDASSGNDLGGSLRKTVAASITRDATSAADWTGLLSARLGWSEARHPAVGSLDGTAFNCGGQDPASGLWSYYCGRAPVRHRFDLSDEVPDSTSETAQLSARFSKPIGRLRLELDASAYSADAGVVRDFDASSTGQSFGVCRQDQSCLGSSGQPALVDRVVSVNEVLVQRPEVRELSVELRLGGDDTGPFSWLLGLAHVDTEEQMRTSIGAERGLLAADEILVALLPATPDIVGPVSRMNAALVEDPNERQVDQAENHDHRRTFAIYGVGEWRPIVDLALRAELRGSWERLETDSKTANFRPSFGKAIPAQEFDDVTPRFSVDYRWDESLRTYLSAAKGSRSGGVNPIPGLVDEEQTFGPESNWTYEAGVRWSGLSALREVRATTYYIDWSDTQIRGFATTPGITNLITLNTAGVVTKGIETSVTLQPASWLRAELGYSHVDAEFRHGSDDPSAGDICGLSAGNSSSTFCTVGPPRTPSPNGSNLVPWLDGNTPAQVPETSWHAALTTTPRPLASGWQLSVRADLSHQDEMYDRGVDAFRYGAKTLLDVRLRGSRGPWSLELWGRNLTDERYVRYWTSRQAQFYPTSPRPLDFVYSDGRRVGITFRYAR